MGYSRTLPAHGGAFRPPPSAKLLRRFSIRKRHLIAPGLNLPNILQDFICDVTDDVTGRVKSKIVVFLSLLASPGKVAVSNWNKAEKRHESYLGYLLSTPKSFVTFRQMKVIKGQKFEKGQI